MNVDLNRSNDTMTSLHNDTLQEISDPSELLAKPLVPMPLVTRPQSLAADDSSDSSQLAQSWKTSLPPSFVGSVPATSYSNAIRAAPLSSSSSASFSTPSSSTNISASNSSTSVNTKTASRLPGWQPPQSFLPQNTNSMVISGSGARVPTQFLDPAGNPSLPIHPHSIQPRPSQLSASSSSKGPATTIDLTGDDDDDDDNNENSIQEVTSLNRSIPQANNPVNAHNVADENEDDEPILVSAKTAAGDEIEVDEARSNAIVCIGLINAVVLCMYGLPQHLTYAGSYDSDPPHDHAYSKPNWPHMTSFWSENGYRPVALSLASQTPTSARALPDGWNYSGSPAKQHADVNVSVVLAPLYAHPHLDQEQAKRLGPTCMSPFGSLAEKYINALEPLLSNNKIRCEARCRMATAGRANNFLHSIELLVFSRRPDAPLVSGRLAHFGVRLETPRNYHSEDYPTQPEYSNPHNPPAAGYGSDMSRYSTIYRGTAMGTVVQNKEMSETQKKEQVDAIYTSIRSGEELAAVDPLPLIRTKLMQHQKQALGFLLNREKEQKWSQIQDKTKPGPASVDKDSRVQGGSRAEKAREINNDDSISLWKVDRALNGKIRSWTNLITQRQVTKQPQICRGAILADDMGLGKTITTIALIANTLAEAKTFGRSNLSCLSGSSSDPVDSSLQTDQLNDDTEEVGAEDFSMSIFGAPPPKKAANTTKNRKGSKNHKIDPETVRRAHLECRSRATLIVCPLSIVSNWEEQVRDHWDKRKQPSIYVYHGQSRITDARVLADHDIVLTTFPTLGTEFSNQSTWVFEDKGKSKKKGPSPSVSESDDDDDDDEAVVLVNENGIPILNADKRKKAPKKRKRRAEDKEALNTLQRIEWFRVVLDEAHYIKGASTWQSKAVCNLSAQRRLCLTGTPIQNSIDDLYALMKFLRLDPFTDRAMWNEFCGHKDSKTALSAKKKEISEPIDSANLGHVQIIMKFLALRRQKDTKNAQGKPILELPPKYSKTVYLNFGEHEKARYQALHNRYKEEFEEMMARDTVNNNYATILHEILNLRLACDHPSLVDASKDAKRKLLGADLSEAIQDDGLSRERAASLFTIFRENSMAFCNECMVDLSHSIEDDTMALKASELDEALKVAAVATAKGRPAKKSRSNPDTPGTASGDGQASAEFLDRPVLTRCQHLFCSSCFVKSVGGSWPQCKASEISNCPACQQALQLVLDAILLEPADFADVDNLNSCDSLLDEDSDSDKYELNDENESKGGQAKRLALGDDSLQARSDLSTKIRALITDLIPFSKCNPHSVLYDASEPRLEHADPTQCDDPHHGESTEPVVVLAKAPATNTDDYEPIKSVVFSQWTKMLDRIQKSLKITGIQYVRLDGTMKRTDRAAAIEKFRVDPATEVLLVSLRAGGVGLNLVQACRAYLMDPYWNPAVENQGLDRVHRMGQTRPVITTKYIMKQSIEENMLRLQERKMMLADKIGKRRDVGDAASRKKERREELKILFS